ALAVTFGEQEFTVPCERDAVRAVGVLARHRNLAAGIEIENLADPDVGEIETAVGGADWAFCENKAFLYKLWRGTWRQHARNTARRLAEGRDRRDDEQRGCAQCFVHSKCHPSLRAFVLLPARRERPRGRRAADERDEFAPPHVRHGASRPGVTTSNRR